MGSQSYEIALHGVLPLHCSKQSLSGGLALDSNDMLKRIEDGGVC
jgi:hypothetical protein